MFLSLVCFKCSYMAHICIFLVTSQTWHFCSFCDFVFHKCCLFPGVFSLSVCLYWFVECLSQPQALCSLEWQVKDFSIPSLIVYIAISCAIFYSTEFYNFNVAVIEFFYFLFGLLCFNDTVTEMMTFLLSEIIKISESLLLHLDLYSTKCWFLLCMFCSSGGSIFNIFYSVAEEAFCS